MNDAQRQAISAKWDAWLGVIHDEISELYANRRIYHDLIEVIRANPRIKGENSLYAWMFDNYAQAAAARIRRLLDPMKRRGPISLRKVTESLCKHPELLKREEYVARYSESAEGEGEKDFTSLAGEGDYLDPGVLMRHLEQVQTVCDRVLSYVDKVVAHHDSKPPEVLPTYKELDEAIEAVGRLFQHIYALLRGATPDLTITFERPWQWVLDEPWVRGRSSQREKYPGWSEWSPLTAELAASVPDAAFAVVRVRAVGQEGRPLSIEHPHGVDEEGIVFIGSSGLDTATPRISGLRSCIEALAASLSSPDAAYAEWAGPQRLRSLWPGLQQAFPDASLEIQYIPLTQYCQTEAIEMRIRTEYRDEFGREPEDAWIASNIKR